MRTKVERTCKKTGQPKVNISLSSPKVVLNANDCARFLGSMGKTSMSLVEKEAKLVDTSPGASLPVLFSATAVSSTIPSQLSPSASTNVSSTLWAATQTKICKNWNSSNSSASAESSDTVHIERSNTDSAQDHHGSSVLPQTILKPPKKRRGGDKKFETTPPPLVFNNGDIIHPLVCASEESSDTCSVQHGSPPILVPSHRGTFQKHSVEQLLQHQPMNASNIHTLITRSYAHDSRLHITLSDSSSLSSKASSVMSSSLSPTLDDYKGRTSFAPQLYPNHFTTKSQSSNNLSYQDHTSSVEIPPSLPLSHVVSVNKTIIQSGGFQELPEQIEPMNLSTSCKPAVGLLSLKMSSTTDIQTAEDVSKTHVQIPLTKDFIESSNFSPLSETLKQVEGAGTNKSTTEIPETANCMSLPKDHHSELNPITPPVQNGVCNSDSNGETAVCVSKTPVPTVEFDLPQEGISQTSIKLSHRDTESPVLFGVENHLVEVSDSKEEQKVSYVIKPEKQSQISISATISPETAASKTSQDTQTACKEATSKTSQDTQTACKEAASKTSQDTQTACKEATSKTSQDTQTACKEELMKNVRESSNLVETEAAKKTKKTPKKKIEIPMDDASCADRVQRYSLTIDNIIVNFVYIPEPIEEFSLTEEEEAAIRDQFEVANDADSSEATHIQTTHSATTNTGTTSKASLHNGYNKVSIEGENLSAIRPLKKRPTSVIEEQSTELHQHMQKTVENIDNVLAFVANDCTDSAPENEISLNATAKVKKQKKLKKPAGDVSLTEMGKRKKQKNTTVCNKADTQNNKGSKGESKGPCAADEKNVSGTCDDNETENSEKNSKPIKVKKRRSNIKIISELNIVTPAEEVGGTEVAEVGTTLLKRKAADVRVKTPKKKKTDGKQVVMSADSVTCQTELILDKGVVANQVETSDIGESIASTSGSSEQDTPVHEQESKDEITDINPQMTDRENLDTGLESGGDDKQPVRRYKKRLDFVKCDQCDHQARGRSALSRHLKKVHMLEAKMPFKCQHCDYGCTKIASLNRHLFTHGVYSCSRCSFVTDERIKLAEHTMEQHKDKVDVKMCKVCNRYIKCDIITIEQHTLECHGPTPFQCAECEKQFKYASSLRVHYHTHYPDQPKRFKCEQCDYRTNYKANLHKHHKNMHASRDRDIQCPDCGKLFSTEDNMRRHRKVHTMIRPFACETCEKTFKTSGALKGHQLVHTSTRPYLCNIPGCNRNFRTPKFLKSHQEEFHRLVPKKFFCSVEGCNYSFFKRSHLKRHAITHTGERNFHCTWPGCIKSFRHADNLKVHFRSHTNEKPVQCHLCDFKCRQKNSLFWHKKRVHQVIDASVCPRRLVQKIKPIDIPDIKKNVTAVPDISEAENIQTAPPTAENTTEALVLVKSPDVTKIAEELPLESKTEDSSLANTIKENSEPFQSPTTLEPVTKTSTTSPEDQAPVDLYEFKSDDETEDETPSSFRRDKSAMNVLTPLPPPPKELLRKNEILEMKEREKKEKAEKKEQEKKEKAEKKQQEKNEKVEKKKLEKKARAERKELELKEKLKMKEQEKKERVEKKEIEKINKLQQKKIERKEKIEKKQQEKREKNEKREQEKKVKTERKELDQNVKPENKLTVETNEADDSENSEDTISPAKSLSNSLKRRKSPVSASKDDPISDSRMCKKGRQKLQEINTEKSKTKKPHKMKGSDKIGALSLRSKAVNIRKREESGESSSSSSSLSLVRAISKRMKRATLKRTHVRRCKRKGKLTPPKRKLSARIKAKNRSQPVKTRAMNADSPISNPIAKGQKSPKPGMKRKYVRRKTASPPKDVEEVAPENIDTSETKTDISVNITTLEVSQAPVEEAVVPTNPCQEDITSLPIRAASPASSEEIMVQGKASPYRDFSEDENLDEQTKSPENCLSQNQASCVDTSERCEMEEGLSPSPSETIYSCGPDEHASHPAEDYSDDEDDDEVSNDIPLTPPRAPAPPPVESSEDEQESEPEPAPFSVPGPNTPFSVPGPNTPFSIPPPTNLMQQHSVNSEETHVSAVHSVPSMEMQGSVDMQQSLESVEIHPRGSVEMNHSHGSVEMHHPQGSFEVPHSHSSMEIRSHNPVEVSSHGSVEMVQSHGSVEMMCHRSITESMPHSDQQVETPESLIMRDISNNSMSEKYELPQSLHEQTQASEADKEYFDQYLKSLSAANNRAANGGLEPSPSGLQQLEAMVGKSHIESKELSRKSPHSCLPTSVITSLESTLPLLSHGDLRARIDAFVSDRHHESLYTRDTPSSLSRISDRQTPLPHSAMGHSPAFDAFSSLNSLHPAGCGRENSYLRQPDNLFPTPPGTNSFMAEAMFQRQAMTTPFLTPQPSDRNSLSRISDASSLQSSSSSSLLRRSGTVASSDMFSPPTMAQSIPRHPFANAWSSQEVRPAHWQTPYLSHQQNMAATGTFFPSKDNYLTGRDFMFDPSIRPSTDRSMFPSLSSSQSQDSFQLDRFDLCNYFPNAMTPYGSSPSSLEYSRSAHVAAAKPFDDRYRQTTTSSATIPDFLGLPPSSSSDMFSGLPGVNSGFNIYAGNPMSYHTQHMADNVNSAFLTHSTSAQHALFERDYAAAAHRSLYPQNTPYPFVDERQYPGPSKLAHAHSGASAVAPQERELVSRSAAPESQMQDPYRSLLYRY